MLVGQDPADPHVCGQLVLRHSDDAADEVLGAFDAGSGIDVHAAMAEHPGGEDGQGHKRCRVLLQRDHVGGQGHLRHVELAVSKHAEEGLLYGESQVGQVDPIGTDRFLLQRSRPVVVPARQGQTQSAHAGRLSLARASRRAASLG